MKEMADNYFINSYFFSYLNHHGLLKDFVSIH